MLKELAKACEKRPTTMAELLLIHCLENSSIIESFQEKYNVNPAYRVLLYSAPSTGYLQHYVVGHDRRREAR